MVEFADNPKSDNVARRYTLQALSRLTALTDADQASVLGALTKVARDGSAPGDVREAALEGLAFLKTEKALPGLVEGMKAKENELRRAAIRGLALLKDKAKDAWSAIEPALRDSDSFIRNQAILATGHIGKEQPEAVKALIQSAAKDGELENRITAIQALGELGKAGEAAVETLESIAKNDVRLRVREAARDAARKIKSASAS
jgi:HEAT repeat protein